MAPRSLQRFQQQSSIKIYAGVLPFVTKEAGLDAMEEIARRVLGNSAVMDYGGVSRVKIRNEGSALTVTLGFALVLSSTWCYRHSFAVFVTRSSCC